MKEIQLTQGQIALVDDDQYEFLMQWKWQAQKDGNTYYAVRSLSIGNGKQHMIKMHHKIIGSPPKSFEVDHRNGQGLDNQRHNLRFVTHRQNQQNRRNGKKKTSQYSGVYWHKASEKWMARIQINGKENYLGLFVDEFEAFKTYQRTVNAIGEEVLS